MDNNLEKLSDKDLFLRMKNANGDLDKYFNVFYERYNQGLFIQSLSILENREEAEDNVQETFKKVYSGLKSFNPEEAKFTTWVYKISMNNAIDKLRKKKTKYKDKEKTFSEFEDSWGFNSEDITMEEYLAGFLNSDKNPEELIIREERNDRLRSHLKNINPKENGANYSLFLTLRHFQEKSYEEIAQELNIPLGTVRGTLNRARGLLEKRLFRDKYFS